MQRIILLTLSLVIMSNLMAQDNKNNPLKRMKTKFDGQSLVEIDYTYQTGSDYKLKMKRPNSGLSEKGKVDNVQRANVAINVPVYYDKKGFIVSTFLRYNYAQTSFDRIDYKTPGLDRLYHPKHEDTHAFSGGVIGAYRTKLFDKSLLLALSVVADGSQKRFENMNGLFTATMTVIETESTRMSVGLFGSTSRAMQFPFFPIFTYRHRFEGTPYIIDIILPKQAHVSRLIGNDGRLSAGFGMDTQHGYVYPNQVGFKHTYTYDRIDMKMEAKYEHMFAKNLIGNINMAFVKCYRGVYREKNDTKDVARFSQNAGVQFNVGLKYILK